MSTRKELRSYTDRAEYLKRAVYKRRRVLKLKAIELAGGRCLLCGYSKHPGVLDFHHIDPATKAFGISSGGFSRSWISMKLKLKNAY